jgi:hypothetical protein
MTKKVTGIGSLPHKSPLAAVTYSMKHDLPFLPQLTSLGEHMIKQALESDAIVENHLALSIFKEQLIENKVLEFKIQIAGPTTCHASSNQILKTIDSLLNYFHKQHQLIPIVFIDEPSFNPDSIELKKILEELKIKKIKSGIHTCAQINMLDLEKLPTEMVALDLELNSYKNINKELIAGINPFKVGNVQKNALHNFVSYTCGLARFTEIECEEVFRKLKA